MTNLIKMDLHRLVRSVSFWVMLVTVIGLAFFSTGMTKYDLDTSTEPSLSLEADADVQISLGISVPTNYEWIDGEIPCSELVNINFASRLMLILCVIFIPLFVNGESKHGFIKNIAGQLSSRGLLILSKLIAAAVQVFIILAVYVVFTAVAGRIWWGERFVPGPMTDLLEIFGLHYLLHFAFGAVVLMLTILFRSSALSMTFGILCSSGFSALAYNVINIALHSAGVSKKFDFGRYMIESNIGCVTSGLEQNDLLRIIIVGAAFTAVSVVISMTVIQKRDIR
ncbi:MAG: hypothetical protein IJ496_03120 [Ruminococcus sp.]|nr:hypothetical protein [Ruminococcus sp.]